MIRPLHVKRRNENLLSISAQNILRDMFVGWGLTRAGSSWTIGSQVPRGSHPRSANVNPDVMNRAVIELLERKLIAIDGGQGKLTSQGIDTANVRGFMQRQD